MVSGFGTSKGGYFSDVLLGLLCSDALALGHDAKMLRVYYDGTHRERDAEISQRLADWLLNEEIDLVVTDRVLDNSPFARWKAQRPASRMLLLPPPEGMASVPPADAALGFRPYERRRDHGEMGDEVRRAFAMWLAADLASAEEADIPGLSQVRHGRLQSPARSLLEATGSSLHFRPVVECEVISDSAITPAPYTVFGNGGCPYSRDVSQAAPYADLQLPEEDEILRKGCAFCTMGGDYDKRTNQETVASVLRQVSYLTEHLPKPHSFVLTDQHPLRYLTLLLERAEAEGIREVTWLLETRADWLVEHRAALEQSIAIAARTETRLQLYLVGFESFSNEDLERYNKGTTREILLAAADLVRELARLHPRHFGYTRDRGHSLILFHPWTSPSSLLESGETLRANGFSDFFYDITRNRLRLYPRLPVYSLAKSQGLVTDDWVGDEASQTARSKGYSVDIAWRFSDPRAAIAYEACRKLRNDLGGETEISQLVAVSRWSAGFPADETPEPDDAVGDLESALAKLSDRFGRLLQGSCGDRAAPVIFAGACNNACHGCENRDRFFPDDGESLQGRVDEAREKGLPVMLAGREPTLHPDFVPLIERARSEDERRVGVVTNGRRFAYGKFTAQAVRSGLSDVSVKVFAPTAELADRICRVEGAHAQAMAGIEKLVKVGVRMEMRVPLHASALDTLADFAELASSHRVGTIRVEVALDSLGLRNLARAETSLEQLEAACRERGVRLAVSPLPCGMRGFDRMPA